MRLISAVMSGWRNVKGWHCFVGLDCWNYFSEFSLSRKGGRERGSPLNKGGKSYDT